MIMTMHENRRHSENSKSKIFILNELLHSRQEYVNNFVVKATYELRTIISLHKIIWLLLCGRHFLQKHHHSDGPIWNSNK